MVTFFWTDEAIRWLQEIYDFIVRENPIAAKRTVDEIIDRIELLKIFPKLGHPLKGFENEARLLQYEHYRIIYRIQSETNIAILGIFHDRLNLKRFL